jgi:hypothetical protein
MWLMLCFLVGCTSYGNVPVFGAFKQVSSTDLSAALAAVQSFHHPVAIYSIRVISADEIWFYYSSDASYWIAKRTNGIWKENGGLFVFTEP